MANLIYDNFKIINRHQNNCLDFKSLTQLYLPLMGIDSYAIYSVFSTMDSDETYTFKKILDLLNFNSLKNIERAIDKLEGLGLIKTYYSETKGYLYEMMPPLSTKEFFENEVLYSLLETQIGEIELAKILSKNKTRVVGYKNLTKKFSDVFEATSRSVKNTMNKMFEKTIDIENKDFNYSLFKILFDNSVVSEDVLNDQEFKSRIERISYLYKLNEDEMKDVIIKTIDVDHNFEYASISKNARLAFSLKTKASGPRIETKTNDSFIPSVLDDSQQELLNYVENFGIADVLESISGIKPSVAEIRMFEDLQNNTHFPTGVINVMILYVTSEKDGEIPSYNYFEKIANTWARAKVKTPYDALKLISEKKEVKETKPYVNKTNKQAKPLPSWYKEYSQNLGKTQTENMSEDEKEELEKLAKDIFG